MAHLLLLPQAVSAAAPALLLQQHQLLDQQQAMLLGLQMLGLLPPMLSLAGVQDAGRFQRVARQAPATA